MRRVILWVLALLALLALAWPVGAQINYGKGSQALTLYTKTLTESVATNLALINLPSGATGAVVWVQTYCTDGTNMVSQGAQVFLTCVNNAGTENCDLRIQGVYGSGATGGATLSTHTLGVSTSPTNGVYLQMTAVCSLAQTTLETYWAVQTMQERTVEAQ